MTCEPFREAHIGEEIRDFLNTLLRAWSVDKERVGYVVIDGGSNMRRGVRLAGLDEIYYFLHQMHLVFGDAIEFQRSIHDAIAKCKAMATHFHKSPKDQKILKDIQVIIE